MGVRTRVLPRKGPGVRESKPLGCLYSAPQIFPPSSEKIESRAMLAPGLRVRGRGASRASELSTARRLWNPASPSYLL